MFESANICIIRNKQSGHKLNMFGLCLKLAYSNPHVIKCVDQYCKLHQITFLSMCCCTISVGTQLCDQSTHHICAYVKNSDQN